jgi:hypothetical protein
MKRNSGDLFESYYLNEGAWGENPLESDSALDMRDNIYKKLISSLIRELNSRFNSEDESRGAVAYDIIGNIQLYLTLLSPLIEFIDNNLKKKIVNLYMECIEICQNDENWMNEWKDDSRKKVTEFLENAKDKLTDIFTVKYSPDSADDILKMLHER